MEFDKLNSAGFLVNHVARLFAEGLRQRIAPLGIVPGQFPALLELWETDGQTQKQLVEKLDIEQATMAHTLARMERDGLVVRKEHPQDGRAKLIFLTPKAKAIRDQAYKAANETNAVALGQFSKSEKKQFLDLINKAIATLRSANDID